MYNKLFTKILDSSIWLESTSTRLLWLVFIAAMDEDGFCAFASVGNLAHRARLSLEETQAALTALESTDPSSSDPDNEGRRIERVQGGWMVLNASKYRELVTRTVAREKTRLRVARHRERHRGNAHVTPSNASVTPSEAYTEAYTPPKAPRRKRTAQQAALKCEKARDRLAKLFNRRDSTKWSKAEERAFTSLEIIPEDLEALERYYTESKNPYLRQKLLTLLNNYSGEVDSALAWVAAGAKPYVNGANTHPKHACNRRVVGTANEGTASQYKGIGQ